ncbi:MAG: zinc-binding dehydrogenase [Chitinophaga sp.]|jgi:threonine dehydrogenase-like Zn-dependent dehydrogenase|nr:zinc-binding dehydrogenase [Chitinophaga sp.]
MVAKVYSLEDKFKLSLINVDIDESNILPNQFIARTLYSTISPGTELAAYIGSPPLRPMKIYPRLLGYCNLAEVIVTGSKVKNLKTGDKVITFQSHRSHFITEENTIVVKLKDDAQLEFASATYLYHLPFHALLRSGFFPSMNVGIVGLGMLGLAAVNLTNTLAGKAYAFSDRGEALEKAKDLGAQAAIPKTDNVVKVIDEDTEGTGLDIIILTSNAWKDWEFALKIVRFSGTICLIGFPGREEGNPDFNPLHSQYIYDKQLKIISAGIGNESITKAHEDRFNIQRNCRFLLDLIQSSKLHPNKLINDTRSYLELEKAYQQLNKRELSYTSTLIWT